MNPKNITIVKNFVFAGNRYICYDTGKSFVFLCNTKCISREQFKTALNSYNYYKP